MVYVCDIFLYGYIYFSFFLLSQTENVSSSMTNMYYIYIYIYIYICTIVYIYIYIYLSYHTYILQTLPSNRRLSEHFENSLQMQGIGSNPLLCLGSSKRFWRFWWCCVVFCECLLESLSSVWNTLNFNRASRSLIKTGLF